MVADFTKRNKVRTVKIGYQRAATILFYIRRSKPPSSIEMSILSNNDEDEESTHENSLQSRYSQDGKDNDNINLCNMYNKIDTINRIEINFKYL